jgi:hypothetical protein
MSQAATNREVRHVATPICDLLLRRRRPVIGAGIGALLLLDPHAPPGRPRDVCGVDSYRLFENLLPFRGRESSPGERSYIAHLADRFLPSDKGFSARGRLARKMISRRSTVAPAALGPSRIMWPTACLPNSPVNAMASDAGGGLNRP